MAFKVVVTTGAEFDRSVFERAGIEVVQQACTTEEEMVQAARDADGILVGITPPTSRYVLENLPKCKVVSRSGVGVDSVDPEAAMELGICVCNTPGANSVQVADHAIALLLSMTRQVSVLDRQVHAGLWTDRPQELRQRQPGMRRIAGGTVGIIGLGNIGRAFAVRIRGFGPARILATDPYIHQTTADVFGAQLVDLDTLLEESDFITIHTPDDETTHHMIGLDQFKRMKSTAYLVNAARGPLVEPNALYEALTEGYIAGAALDVTEPEPLDAESPLLKLDNLVVTPHYAGFSAETVEDQLRRWGENVALVLQGQPPHGLANPDVVVRIALMKAQGDSRWDNVGQPRYGLPFLPGMTV